MTITLKNVPREIHRRLKAKAKLHKRSLTQEALTGLEVHVGILPPDRQALHARIIKLRNEIAAGGFVGMTQEELRAAIDEGRE